MPNIKPKIVAVIQARMGSKRLPKKALKRIAGRTLIEWIKYRLSFCQEVDQIVLSTADNKVNDPLAKLAESIGLEYFRGSEMDLVQRIHGTAEKFSADTIIRITGDCPLVDPELVDKMVRIYRQKFPDIDYVANILPPTFPDGMDIEIISRKTLNKLDREVRDSLYREWITTTIMENPQNFKIYNFTNKDNLSYLRLTVDYPEDFELAKIIFTKLHKEGKIFTLKDILDLFKKEPELVKINEKWVDKEIINNIRGKAFHDLKHDLKQEFNNN
jgi:spore coat polysaccharide biosynthesis protein SpsF